MVTSIRVPRTASLPTSSRARRSFASDRWLAEAVARAGGPVVEIPARTGAWEALEVAGVAIDAILRAACERSGVAPARIESAELRVADHFPRALAERYGVAPVALRGDAIEVATANPLDNVLEQMLAFALGRRVCLSVASPAAIRDLQRRLYEGAGAASAARADRLGATAKGMKGAAGSPLAWVTAQSPVPASAAVQVRGASVDALDRILIEALEQRASEIHLDPMDGELVVRFRVDGVLRDAARVGRDVAPLVMNRVKVTAGLDVAERLRSQHGRSAVRFAGRAIDIRVSTLPIGSRDERAVLRILDSSTTGPDLEILGLAPEEVRQLEAILAGDEGLVLVAGPAGSGKTTTLHSLLRQLRTRKANVVTLGNSLECRLEGVEQVQEGEKTDLTFASALRASLRQSPDAVFVGDIPDGETARLSMHAGMTGHVVLGSLQVNDASAAIARLVELGGERWALAGALRGVVAQRLVRRLCDACSVQVTPDELPPAQRQLLEGHRTDRLRRAVGCPACRNTGYRGRMVVAEVLVATDELRRAVARGEGTEALLDIARAGGMRSLWEAGFERVLAGTTSLHELLDTIAPSRDAVPEVEKAGTIGQAAVDRLLGSLRARTAAPAKPMASPARQRSMAAAAPSAPSRIRRGTGAAPAHPLILRDDRTWPRILVAHDDRAWRRSMREQLVAAGCTVIEAAHGGTALAFARRLAPDAIVTDVALPVMDAAALLAELEPDSPTRVVVYTEQDDEQLVAWLRELGAAEVLRAQNDIASVAQRVVAMVRRRWRESRAG